MFKQRTLRERAAWIWLIEHACWKRDHCLRTNRSGLSLPTCHALDGEFSTQRINVVED
jgi:hypothetical protein